MTRILGIALIGTAIGLGIGYAVFGRIAGEFIPLEYLFRIPENDLEGTIRSIGQSIAGIQQARQSILVSGGVGLAVGAVTGALTSRRARG